MNKAARRYPEVTPPSGHDHRPRWSVMIPTYNCAVLAQEAIKSVIAQDPGIDRCEIVVVDDASDDDVAGMVAQFEGRVNLHRQPANLGVPANLTEAIRLSRGEIVHLLHGDDIVLPGFYAAMDAALADPGIGAAWCRQIFMDGGGNWIGISPIEIGEGRVPDAACFLASAQRIMTPSICVRRSVYEAVGGFDPELRCVEDWEMWVRIAARYPIYHIHAPLAVYRMHPQSNTGRNLQDAGEMVYARRAISLFAAHLPKERAAPVVRAARRATARYALDTGDRLARVGNRKAGFAQIRAALALSQAPEVVARALFNVLRMARLA